MSPQNISKLKKCVINPARAKIKDCGSLTATVMLTLLMTFLGCWSPIIFKIGRKYLKLVINIKCLHWRLSNIRHLHRYSRFDPFRGSFIETVVLTV